ncbi:endospore coat-associated protein [Cohnella kolymensis]|uniref:Endospore coat-associated protein n=2 Tax=Cohnella kolymensis TaxID=1590652 RepID=A0ABR5A5J9_9BACL|nr:endospore coat-associated protein [Cohnella kolymensis]
MPIQRVRSKLAKTKPLVGDPVLHEFVPDTRAFNRGNVQQMLDKYEMIYVKPVRGTFGKGVIRVKKKGRASRPYRFQSGLRKYRFGSFDYMYRKLLALKQRKAYLTQQGIHLLKHGGRRFDLRIMVQKNPRSFWETTGIIGRLAHPGKVVTNYHSGGTPLPIDKLLSNHMSSEEILDFQKQLQTLGVNVAKVLEKRFPRLKEIGVDAAIDQNKKLWILEVNTLPDPFLFRKLRNPDIFRRMYAYAVSYGRFPIKRRRKM